ncbi:GH-E family nuclease [Lysinibacillus sp. G4S2]|nr:GH-E family nuclease [Lysinibacillus sp. G4S2]MDM5250394.1 GH-E family nuclease [Lysinibacillus sp. G4S2]
MDPETGSIIPKDQVTIEHIEMVVDHWNTKGFDMSRKERFDWYNNIKNLTVKPRSVNSSEGAASGKTYRQDTGPNYSNNKRSRKKNLTKCDRR